MASTDSTTIGSEQQAVSGTLPIVVGVDGSQCSEHALAWAARQAELTGAPLKVVGTWMAPTSYGWAAPIPGSLDLATEMQHTLERSVSAVLGDDPGIDVEIEVLTGHPATVLTELSGNAGLVVVGSRGHGGFVGLLLGSVSEHLTTHANCPVVIIRPQPPVKAAHAA